MTFDRVRWLEETMALADADPGPDLNGRKRNLAELAMLADENGVIQVAAYERALGLPEGDLRKRWGESLALSMPG